MTEWEKSENEKNRTMGQEINARSSKIVSACVEIK